MTVRASDNGAVRDDPPVATDFGLVVRPLGAGPGGSTEVLFRPTNGVATNVPANAVAVVLLAASPTRVKFSIRNHRGPTSSSTLYILAGPGIVSPALYTAALPPGAYYEDPARCVDEITGVWDPAPGGADFAAVTDYQPVP